MTAQSEQRVRHRRKVTKRRAVVAGICALGITGAAPRRAGRHHTSLLPSAGAAASWPLANGSNAVSSTIKVSGTYDGKLTKFYGSGALGGSGLEEGQDPVFQLADGAVLKNVIIGTPAADGVHCLGSCTLQNVWWLDVGEDAATFKGKSSSAVYTVYGGGAKNADDKVLQFNGAGKLVVTKFQIESFGKLVRSCGDCSTQYKRTIIVNDVDVTAPGKSIVGINSDYGGTAALRKIRIHGDSAKNVQALPPGRLRRGRYRAPLLGFRRDLRPSGRRREPFLNGRPRITVNDWVSAVPTAPSQPSTRSLTTGSYRGNNHMFTFNVPNSAWKTDTTQYNVLKIDIVSGSTGSAYLSPGTSFDCIDLPA